MPEPILPDQVAATEARLAELRSLIRSGPVSLDVAAEALGTTGADLMAALIANEVAKVPGTAAIITGADGCATVKRAGAGEVSITVPALLGQVLLAGLLHDPATRAAICAPLCQEAR